MIFVGDLAAEFGWLAPAPVGVVEDGWIVVVADMLADVDRAVAARPGTTVDVVDITERDGALLCDLVVDGTDDASVTAAVVAAVARARHRAASTCCRCGAPGRLRLDRVGWPATRCDAHAFGTRPSW